MLNSLLLEHLQDPESSWFCSRFGAIAESIATSASRFSCEHPLMRELLAATIRSDDSQSLDTSQVPPAEGSVVPMQKRRMLVCMGSPCHAAGAGVVRGHLRNEQKRLSLRTVGGGAMSARTSCLGPCSLAPVLQVWPKGTLYGGVDEDGTDRIIRHHLLASEVVEDLAYRPTGAKQRLRR